MFNNRKLKTKNKGFTLVEVLIAVVLLVAIGLTVGSVIMNTQNSSNKMLTENELQQQLVQSQNSVHETLLQTTNGIKYFVKDTKNSEFRKIDKDDGTTDYYEKVLACYSVDYKDFVLEKKYYRYKDNTLQLGILTEELEKLNDEKQVLQMDNTPAKIQATIDSISDWSTVGIKMDEFAVDVSTYGNDKLISFDMSMKQDDAKYPTNDTVYIRNDIYVNQDIVVDEYHTVKIPKPSLKDNMFTYDQTEHSPVELNFFDKHVVRDPKSTLKAVNAGTYTIRYKLIDKVTTTWEDGSIDDVIVTWTINPKALTLQWGETQWIYDGQTHSTTCSVDGVLPGDTVQVLLGNNSVGPNIGKQTVTAKITNTNYVLPLVNTVDIEIVKSEPSVTIANKKGLIYNTHPQELITYSNLQGGTLEIFISTSKTSGPASIHDFPQKHDYSRTDVGTYYVWYYLKANDPNYVDGPITYLGETRIAPWAAASAKATNPVYTGSKLSGYSGSNVTFTGDLTGINAGTYKVTATPKPNFVWEGTTDDNSPREVQWEIQKADAVADRDPQAIPGLQYNGQSQELITPGVTRHGVFQYKHLQAGSPSTDIPTAVEAGAYTIQYFIKGDANHKDSPTKVLQVTIDKAALATLTVIDKTYAEGQELTGIINRQHVVEVSGCNGVNVGTYVAVLKPDKNHLWTDGTSGEKSFPWKILRARTAEFNNLNPTYNGSEQAGVSGKHVQLTGHPRSVNAGDYTAYATPDSNHAWSDGTFGQKQITWTMARARTASVEYYNRGKLSGSADWTCPDIFDYTGGTIYTFANSIRHAYAVESGASTGTNVGTYDFMVTPDSNHAWDDGSTRTRHLYWEIGKKAPNVGPVTARSLTYNHQAQQLVNVPTSSDGYYEFVNNGQWSRSIPTGVNAGTHVVRYRFIGDANHFDLPEQSINVTIAKANPLSHSMTYPQAVDRVYDGTYKPLATPGSTSCGTIYYKLWSDGAWSTSIPEYRDAYDGTNYNPSDGLNVYWYVRGDANHYDSSVSHLAAQIRRAPMASVSIIYGLKYNGGSQYGVSGSYVTWGGVVQAVNAGSYAAYAEPERNYTWSNGGTEVRRFDWSIGQIPATFNVQPTGKSLTYNEAAQALINVGSASGGWIRYSLNGSDWTTTSPTAVNAGTYTIICELVPDGNHYAPARINVQTTIARLGNTAHVWYSAANQTSYEVGQWDPGVKYSYTGGTINESKFIVNGKDTKFISGTSGVAQGVYYKVAQPMPNYAWRNGETGNKNCVWRITGFPVGSSVRLTKGPHGGRNYDPPHNLFPEWVYSSRLYVRQISSSGAGTLISTLASGDVTGWCYTDDLVAY